MRGAVRAFSSLLVLLSGLSPSTSSEFPGTTGRRHRRRRLFRRRLRRPQGCRPGRLQGRLQRRRSKCQAFTYNTAARWCFLKSDVGELRAVEGAVSGKIVDRRGRAAARRRGRAHRRAELPRRSPTSTRRATSSASSAARRRRRRRHRRGASPPRQRAKDSGDYLTALDSYRAALTLEPDRLDLWTDFTDTAIRASSDDWEVQADAAADTAPPAPSTPISAPSPPRTAPMRWS